MDVFEIIVLMLSALVGAAFVWFAGVRSGRTLKLLLSFSGAFLFGITVLHLLPEVYHQHGINAGAYVLIGFILQILLEFFSKGVEHGHMHLHDLPKGIFPISIFISLCIHSFMEGMPLGHDHGGDHALLSGIAIHKLPVAVTLASILVSSGSSKTKLVVLMLLFALMAPVGVFVGEQLEQSNLAAQSDAFSIILAIVAGMFLHISTTILFEISHSHKFDSVKFGVVMVGSFLAYVIT